ncbi:MAG: cytidine deaminase [Bacillales bacterium]|nr:cytidine deaminase [Bacillales bacterium]
MSKIIEEFLNDLKDLNKLKKNEVVLKALKVKENSYSPYSHFRVGAALLFKDGNVLTGVNVENASFGLSNCAERSVIFESIGKGYKKEDILALVVSSDSNIPASPCGACRQVISELLPLDTPVICVSSQGTIAKYNVQELLPFGFSSEQLGN